MVGYPDLDENELIEPKLLRIFNSLPELADTPLTEDDIDISRAVKSERRDGKNVAIRRFVRRKSKFKIPNSKKVQEKLMFQDHDIYINDHLSPYNRKLFAACATFKYNHGFKYLWVRDGTIFLRKSERSTVKKIFSETDLQSLLNEINATAGPNIDGLNF